MSDEQILALVHKIKAQGRNVWQAFVTLLEQLAK